MVQLQRWCAVHSPSARDPQPFETGGMHLRFVSVPVKRKCDIARVLIIAEFSRRCVTALCARTAANLQTITTASSKTQPHATCVGNFILSVSSGTAFIFITRYSFFFLKWLPRCCYTAATKKTPACPFCAFIWPACGFPRIRFNPVWNAASTLTSASRSRWQDRSTVPLKSCGDFSARVFYESQARTIIPRTELLKRLFAALGRHSFLLLLTFQCSRSSHPQLCLSQAITQALCRRKGHSEHSASRANML